MQLSSEVHRLVRVIASKFRKFSRLFRDCRDTHRQIGQVCVLVHSMFSVVDSTPHALVTKDKQPLSGSFLAVARAAPAVPAGVWWIVVCLPWLVFALRQNWFPLSFSISVSPYLEVPPYLEVCEGEVGSGRRSHGSSEPVYSVDRG